MINYFFVQFSVLLWKWVLPIWFEKISSFAFVIVEIISLGPELLIDVVPAERLLFSSESEVFLQIYSEVLT